jgi:hypothetical protein
MVPPRSKFAAFALLLCISYVGVYAKQLAHIDDPAEIATIDAGWASSTESKLERIESLSGIKVVLQFHAKAPSAQEDSVAGAYMKALSTSLGTAQKGVLIVYFADDPDWRIWVGDDLAARFAGKAGSAAELTANGGIHNAKEAYLDTSVAKADADFKSAPGPSSVSRRIRMEADALLDNLCLKLQIKTGG